MTARELGEEILKRIEQGELDPNAVLVRPCCTCDEEIGYVEAMHIDQVIRRWESADVPGTRLYKYGNVELSDNSTVTIKLG